MRFLNQFTTRYGDYTEERDALFADKTLDDILTEIKLERAPPDNETQAALDKYLMQKGSIV